MVDMNSMMNTIMHGEETPMSSSDMKRVLGSSCKIINYEDLSQYYNIDQLLHVSGYFILFYPIEKKGMGHWTAVLDTYNDNGQRVVEFFDPYGLVPDSELKYGNYGNMPHYLSMLLSRSSIPVTYNAYDFQQKTTGIDTCGRHCCLRAIYKDLPLSVYTKCFSSQNGVSSDEIVSVLIQ